MQPPAAVFVLTAVAHEARASLKSVSDGSASLRQALRFCQLARMSAVAKLLIEGTPTGFFVDATRAGRAFLHYLSRRPDSPCPTSRALPFFDAVAGGDFDCAERIAGAVAQNWIAQLEYEEDFLYMRFLMRAVKLGRATGDEFDALLARYAVVLDGRADPRFEVCGALRAGRDELFEAALGALMESEYDGYIAALGDGSIDPDEAVTTKLVSLEGLALSGIAARLGLGGVSEVRSVPSLAMRMDLRPTTAPDDWMRI
jgi:hypothetical protein